MVKRLPTVWETWVQSLGREDLLEKEMVTHSSILAWKIPWTEEPGRLQSMGLQSQTWLSDLTGLQATRLLCPWDFPGKSTGVGCHCLLQRIFLTQGSNPGLPHCRQTLYHLSHQGSPSFVKCPFKPFPHICRASCLFFSHSFSGALSTLDRPLLSV